MFLLILSGGILVRSVSVEGPLFQLRSDLPSLPLDRRMNITHCVFSIILVGFGPYFVSEEDENSSNVDSP